jgi:hypothetical protein
MNLYDEFECAFSYACLHLSSLNSIDMLVWCMLVVGLNDEIKKLACIGDRYALLCFYKYY